MSGRVHELGPTYWASRREFEERLAKLDQTTDEKQRKDQDRADRDAAPRLPGDRGRPRARQPAARGRAAGARARPPELPALPLDAGPRLRAEGRARGDRRRGRPGAVDRGRRHALHALHLRLPGSGAAAADRGAPAPRCPRGQGLAGLVQPSLPAKRGRGGARQHGDDLRIRPGQPRDAPRVGREEHGRPRGRRRTAAHGQVRGAHHQGALRRPRPDARLPALRLHDAEPGRVPAQGSGQPVVPGAARGRAR